VDVAPTTGFSVEKIKYGHVNFSMFDMSGAGQYRNYWEHLYGDAQVRCSNFR
jgi:ADP-ribosylation factor-like protein 6